MNQLKELKIFLISILLILTMPSIIFAINAPTLLTASSKDGYSILLTWRNNDLTADEIIIFSKSELNPWKAIDTIPSVPARFTDSRLFPARECSYYLVSKSDKLLSNSSNILSATIPQKSLYMKTPGMAGVWDREDKSIKIHFIDSANSETGFRLWRRSIPNNWICIDSLKSSNPGELGSHLRFTDQSVVTNSWYIYWVEVYNDSNSFASNKDTLYTYNYPERDTGYVISKLGAYPINPAGWIEKVGDLLYVLESKPQGDNGIAVIDVSDAANPSFIRYLDTDNPDTTFKGTVLWPRIKLRINEGKIVFGDGCYLYRMGNLLYLRDSSTHELLDTLFLPGYQFGRREFKFEGKFSNTSLYAIEKYYTVKSYAYTLFLINFGRNGIEPLKTIAAWNEIQGPVHSEYQYVGSFDTKSIIVNHVYGMGRNYYIYSLYDAAAGTDSVLYYEEKDGYCPVSRANQLHSSIGFGYSDNGNKRTVYAFDILDTRFSSSFNLGSITHDITNKNSQFHSAFIEQDKNRLYIFDNASFSIYQYEGVDASLKLSKRTKRNKSSLFSTVRADGSMEFTVNAVNRTPEKITLCNLKGRVIATVPFQNENTVIWGNPDYSPRKAPSGAYAAIVHFKDGLNPEVLIIRQ